MAIMKEIKPLFFKTWLIKRCLKNVCIKCHETVTILSTNLYGTGVQKIYVYLKKLKIEIAVNSVVSNHNDGFLALKNIVENLGLNP